MTMLEKLLGEEIKVEISGNKRFTGILIDLGLDILVLYNGIKYLYFPMIHIQNITKRDLKYNDESIPSPQDHSPFQYDVDPISYRKVLTNAKGQFLEIFVTGNKSIHGYIINVFNDYIVFYSPVFKTMLISMQHLKWLIPYTSNLTPYTLSNTQLPVLPTSVNFARSFEEQLKKYENQLVVFDLGDNPQKIGLLKNISNNIVEIVNADGSHLYWKLSHLKSVHIPGASN